MVDSGLTGVRDEPRHQYPRSPTEYREDRAIIRVLLTRTAEVFGGVFVLAVDLLCAARGVMQSAR